MNHYHFFLFIVLKIIKFQNVANPKLSKLQFIINIHLFKIGPESNFYCILHLNIQKINNLELMSHGMMHIANFKVIFYFKISFQIINK